MIVNWAKAPDSLYILP